MSTPTNAESIRAVPRRERASSLPPVPDAARRNATLREAVERLERGDDEGARASLRTFPPLRAGHPADLEHAIFLRALSRRAAEHGALDDLGNLYLRDFAFRQIDLFNLLAERMPLVRKAAEAANQLLFCELLQKDDPVLVDVGIGTGRQHLGLLRLLAPHGARIGRLRIVGVEPSVESLRAAEGAILRTAAALRLDVEFHPVLGCIEKLPREAWSVVSRLGRGAVFNEAFSLHHVAHRPGAYDLKDTVLRRIADLEPSLLVCAEPDSDHHSERLSVRFANAFRHFGLVFEVVDRIAATQQERDAIKVLFFAREIDDILVAPEHERAERHETAEMWLRRLRRAGFRVRDALSTFHDGAEETVRFAWKGDHLGLDVRGETVVSLLAVGR